MVEWAVADAGPLIAFGRIRRLDLLPQVLGKVLVPDAVATECLADPGKPGARAIDEALRSRLLVRIPDPAPDLLPYPVLDAGESAAIRLALHLPAAVLLDEKVGRKIAANLGVRLIGNAGVLLAAKQRGLIEGVGPIIDAFAASGYHYSADLLRAILERAGER